MSELKIGRCANCLVAGIHEEWCSVALPPCDSTRGSTHTLTKENERLRAELKAAKGVVASALGEHLFRYPGDRIFAWVGPAEAVVDRDEARKAWDKRDVPLS